jgi:hypothetical protein
LQAGRDSGEGYNGWQTYAKLAVAVEGGMQRDKCKRCLESAPHLFVSITGQEATAVGARRNTTVWGLTSWPEAPATLPGVTAPLDADEFPF